MDKIEALVKQYELVNAESSATIGNRISILSFGLATLGAIFTGNIILITSPGKEVLASLIFFAVIPIISIAILYLWLGEVHRMIRAGLYLKDLEDKINSLLKYTAFNWEHHLRNSSVQIKYPYAFICMLFFGISFCSIFLGLYVIKDSLTLKYILAIGSSNIIFHSIIVIMTYKKIVSKFK